MHLLSNLLFQQTKDMSALWRRVASPSAQSRRRGREGSNHGHFVGEPAFIRNLGSELRRMGFRGTGREPDDLATVSFHGYADALHHDHVDGAEPDSHLCPDDTLRLCIRQSISDPET